NLVEMLIPRRFVNACATVRAGMRRMAEQVTVSSAPLAIFAGRDDRFRPRQVTATLLQESEADQWPSRGGVREGSGHEVAAIRQCSPAIARASAKSRRQTASLHDKMTGDWILLHGVESWPN